MNVSWLESSSVTMQALGLAEPALPGGMARSRARVSVRLALPASLQGAHADREAMTLGFNATIGSTMDDANHGFMVDSMLEVGGRVAVGRPFPRPPVPLTLHPLVGGVALRLLLHSLDTEAHTHVPPTGAKPAV